MTPQHDQPPKPSTSKLWRVFAPARLRRGYRTIRARAETDSGFKRACLSAVLACALLTIIIPPLGLFALWFSLVHTMPRSVLEDD